MTDRLSLSGTSSPFRRAPNRKMWLRKDSFKCLLDCHPIVCPGRSNLRSRHRLLCPLRLCRHPWSFRGLRLRSGYLKKRFGEDVIFHPRPRVLPLPQELRHHRLRHPLKHLRGQRLPRKQRTLRLIQHSHLPNRVVSPSHLRSRRSRIPTRQRHLPQATRLHLQENGSKRLPD